MNTLSSRGEALIKSFELLELIAYQDQKGVWTIGWGHTGPEVVEDLKCTPDQAEEWFLADSAHAVKCVDESLQTNVSQNQFDAVVSFAFNVGVGAEQHSTMLKLLNARDFAGAAAEFPKWDHVDGVENAGLKRRRLAEQTLFLDTGLSP
jgi:lysozyme